ncbi:MAG: sigma-70 family RNA polymerase sigma factor [Polyangiales bacterium]
MLDRQTPQLSSSDGELIALTAAGNHRAFELLVERHASAVLRLTTMMTGNSASGEDALQQAFLSAFRNASSFRAEASVRTWLLTIARHTAYRFRAKQAREAPFEEPLMKLGLDAGWGSDNPESLAMAAERDEMLHHALRTLSSDDQEVLVLRDMEGLSGAEAAQILEINERALKSRLHRARLRLAVALRATLGPERGEREGGPQ